MSTCGTIYQDVVSDFLEGVLPLTSFREDQECVFVQVPAGFDPEGSCQLTTASPAAQEEARGGANSYPADLSGHDGKDFCYGIWELFS